MKMGESERSALANLQSSIAHGGQEAYSMKATEYFAGARRDYVAELPINSQARILEIGCGEGGTGALALSEGKCGVYCGVELCHKAAEKAKQKLTEVVVGNIEDLQLPWGPATFDAVILSEVLEHLVDPWAALRRIRPLLKPKASVFASSPNISHYSAIRMLLRGQWDLTDVGLMDRTHLRWFTPSTYRALFESCGYAVNSAREKEPFRTKARIASALTFGRFRYLFIGQIDLRARCS
jgi:2-polyprenyl-3-methyl-5-hydroxy-6-metoxy-1,4-benzoquinol methylase